MSVIEIKHPLIEHKLSNLRNKYTDTKLFRESLNEIAGLMTYEATKDLEVKEVETETPLQKTITKILSQPVTLVPILRAGLGMVEGIQNLIPNAKIGHIGIYRDHDTLKPVEYLCKLPPNMEKRDIIILDPMLATGGSVNYTIDYLKGVGVSNISFLCIIAAPEGIAKVVERHPDVDIYTACIDEGLNEQAYIYPGLGDAGDRIFGTK